MMYRLGAYGSDDKIDVSNAIWAGWSYFDFLKILNTDILTPKTYFSNI